MRHLSAQRMLVRQLVVCSISKPLIVGTIVICQQYLIQLVALFLG